MKAKFVNEKFNDESDVIADMSIGKSKRAKELLEKEYYSRDYGIGLKYTIKSLDDILIQYDVPDTNTRWKDEKMYEYYKNIYWKLKYVEVPRYVLNDVKRKETFYDTPINYHDWNIYEVKMWLKSPPEELSKSTKLEFVMKVGEYGNEDVKEMAHYIVDCLNKKYPTVAGFELVETNREEMSKKHREE